MGPAARFKAFQYHLGLLYCGQIEILSRAFKFLSFDAGRKIPASPAFCPIVVKLEFRFCREKISRTILRKKENFMRETLLLCGLYS